MAILIVDLKIQIKPKMDNGTWTPNVLLLGSGGIKGFLTIGSLMFFEKTKLLKNIKKVVGISIGSVIGLFYVVGCSVTEMLEIALMTQLSEVMTNIDIVNIMRTNGLVSHDIFRKRMNDKVMEKFGFVPTLEQLYMMTGYEFEVVVTNLDKDEAEYFNHQTQPKLSCVEAVLMSMSIPLLFQTYIYNNHIYVDGAICDPFPIHRYVNDKVFGIMLKSTHDDPKESFYNYLAKVIHQFTSNKLKNMEIPPECKILNLEYKVNDTIGMKITFEKRVDMVLLGYLRAYQFYTELYKSYPTTIQKYHSQDFFSSLPFDKKQEDMILQYVDEPSEVDTNEMEEEGDEYLEELFDSDLMLSDIDSESSSDWDTSESEEDRDREQDREKDPEQDNKFIYPTTKEKQEINQLEEQLTLDEPQLIKDEKREEELGEKEWTDQERSEQAGLEPPEQKEEQEEYKIGTEQNNEVNIQNGEQDSRESSEEGREESDDGQEGGGQEGDVARSDQETDLDFQKENDEDLEQEGEEVTRGTQSARTSERLGHVDRRLSDRLSQRMSSLRKVKIYSPSKIISGMKKSKKKYKKKHKKPEWAS
jgi:predicted acylesterase/phospholipase RssA